MVVLTIASQYVVPGFWPASRLVYGSFLGVVGLVYGVPVVVLAVLLGSGPLRHWRTNLRGAAVEGLGWYGAMSLLAALVIVTLETVYAVVDPGALRLLERPNPALQAAAGDPWLYVGLSFVIGAFEETIFRGWIFGYWSGRSRSWFLPAILSSALFAGVHVYYGVTYGVASPVPYSAVFLDGFAFAATYRGSGGNLVVPAALHGATDATAFLTLISVNLGFGLHWLLVLLGAVLGLVFYARLSSSTAAPRPAWPAPSGP